VKRFVSTAAQRLAPRTLQNLRRLSALDPDLDRALPLLLTYERELRALQREVDELRRDHRRVAELYDAVFEWVHANAEARGSTPDADGAGTVARVARELAEGE
jgi:type II secretory pathway component PulK